MEVSVIMGKVGEGMFGNRFAEVRVRTFWLEKVGCGDERPIITVKTTDPLFRRKTNTS